MAVVAGPVVAQPVVVGSTAATVGLAAEASEAGREAAWVEDQAAVMGSANLVAVGLGAHWVAALGVALR